MEEYLKKLEDLKDSKTWITDSERQDVKDKMLEIQDWLKKQMEDQSSRQLYEDPVFKSGEVIKKMANLKKLFNKVNNKRKPKPEKKKEEEKEEEESKEEEKS